MVNWNMKYIAFERLIRFFSSALSRRAAMSDFHVCWVELNASRRGSVTSGTSIHTWASMSENREMGKKEEMKTLKSRFLSLSIESLSFVRSTVVVVVGSFSCRRRFLGVRKINETRQSFLQALKLAAALYQLLESAVINWKWLSFLLFATHNRNVAWEWRKLLRRKVAERFSRAIEAEAVEKRRQTLSFHPQWKSITQGKLLPPLASL